MSLQPYQQFRQATQVVLETKRSSIRGSCFNGKTVPNKLCRGRVQEESCIRQEEGEGWTSDYLYTVVARQDNEVNDFHPTNGNADS